MKKLLIAVLLLMAACLCAHAEETEPEAFTCGDFEYVLLEDGTAEIVNYMGLSGALEIPQNLHEYEVTSIGDYAFYSLECLTDVTIPDSVTSIGSNPFHFCYNLTDIHVSPDHPTLTTIDGVLFEKIEKKLVTYPMTFSAESYSIPNGTISIGDSAFHGCISLTSISIPDSVTSIDSNPFAFCDMLTDIHVSPDHPTLATIGGVLFEKTEKELVACPMALSPESYSIPNGTISIGDYAFASCYYLGGITVPDSVTSIGDSAFSNCYSLTGITIPDSVTSIGDWAFSSCNSLTGITLPSSVTAIGNNAFEYCPDLTLSVERDSYAYQYVIENELPYTCID